MDWIKIEDKLPDETFDFILVFSDGAMSTIAYTAGNGFYEAYPIKTQIDISLITHWMPLPDSPK